MKKICFLLFLLVLPGLMRGQAQSPQQKSLAITHVTVIDATGSPPKTDMTVVIIKDRITELARTGELSIPADAQVVDASGKFLIPGLWDMHVHTWYPDVMFLPLFIANGVTGVRDTHAPWEHFEQIKQWRKEIASGKIIGPRIISSGPLVDGPQSRIKPQHAEVSNSSAGREVVDTLKRRGADFVKVYDWLSRDSYYAIVDEAKTKGMPYTGHVPFAVSAAEASDARQNIEHLSGILLASSTDEAKLRAELTEGRSDPDGKAVLDTYSDEKAAALFARFARNGTWLTPTLMVTWASLGAYTGDHQVLDPLKYMPLSYRQGTHKISTQVPRLKQWGEWDPKGAFRSSEDLAQYKRRFEKYLEIVGKMRQAGVQLMTGTDTLKPFNLPGFSLQEELSLLVKAGLTPMEVLQAATRNPAKFLGMADSLGTVEKGKVADLVLLEASPLEEISNTQRIAAVIVGGRFISKSSLQGMLAGVEAAAKNK
ncbi:MAG: amidohydrolase family protein [Acidobacteria bacterium]|nr:amidohydrolase family protein [Acidobacteriota bacterium]